MSNGWAVYVILLTALNLVGCAWLLYGNRNVQIDPEEKGRGTGHDFDGIEELNNPLPAWWTWLFVVTLVFGVAYLVLYPGLGRFAGTLGWTSANQLEAEIARADARYGPIFRGYYEQQIPELLDDERAVAMGGRIFANNCAACHGSDARGGTGYPNLTDNDWLYGGEPDTIKRTVTHGRRGIMPPVGPVIGGDEGIQNVTEYVLSLSGREHDAERARAGAEAYAKICVACHLPSGTGMRAVGAPDLTDNVWLHGGRREDIQNLIRTGLSNQMPAHERFLDPEQIHLVALYVYSLSARAEEGSE